MSTENKNGHHHDLDGAGSILSTVGGPSNAEPPSSLGAGTLETARLLTKVVADAALAAEMPFNPAREVDGVLLHKGAQPRMVGARLGQAHIGVANHASQGPIDVEITFDTGPSVTYDGVVLPGGIAASTGLVIDPRVRDFLREQYRHGKPILALGAADQIIDAAGLPRQLPGGADDPGLIVAPAADLAAALTAFQAALAGHRIYARETDLPRV